MKLPVRHNLFMYFYAQNTKNLLLYQMHIITPIIFIIFNKKKNKNDYLFIVK